MSKWAHADVLDNGPNYIKNNCNVIVALLAYSAGDSYAAVIAGSNVLAQTSMSSIDFTNGSSGGNRTLTSASGKQDTNADADGDPTHIAFLDTATSKVLWVTDETGSVSITTGSTVIFPSLVYTASQLV